VTGASGPTGPTGPTGPIGETGVTGPAYTGHIVLTAAGGWGSATNGATQATAEATTNKENYYYLDFADGATEYQAEWTLVMPSNWNAGTITAVFVWTATTLPTNKDVIWGIQGYAYGDNVLVDSAWGTAQVVTDTMQTANAVHISAATSAMTFGGTPAASQLVQLRVYRNSGAAGDTLTVNARLLAVRLTYTLT
jgi:hypothetical protein